MKRFLFLILAALLLVGPAVTPAQAIFVNSDIQSPTITRRIASIADLRLVIGKSSIPAVSLDGYYAEGDGGGGPERYWASGAAPGTYVDNGGSIIVPTAGDGSAAWLWDWDGPIGVRWFGISPDKIGSDNQARFTAMDGALSTGDIVVASPGLYPQAGNLTITKGYELRGYGATFDWPSDVSPNRGFIIIASGASIKGLTLDGPQFASAVATQVGILATGVDNGEATPPTTIADIDVIDCQIFNWTYDTQYRFVIGGEVSGSTLKDGNLAGFSGLSVSGITVTKSKIHNFIGGTSSFGVQFSKNNGDAVRFPPSSDCSATKNEIWDIPEWTALDTHGGESISFIDNDIYDCFLGAVVTRYSSGGLDIGPKNCRIIGNSIINKTLPTTAIANAIQIVGAPTDHGSNNIASNNTISGYGDSDALVTNNFSASMFLQATGSTRLTNNTVVNSGKVGICALVMGENSAISNNTINGITGAGGVAIYLDTDAAGGGIGTGSLSDNNINVPGHTAFFFEDVHTLDMNNNNIISATTNYDQTGGVFALQFADGTVSPVSSGTDTWDPASIPAGGSETHTINSIPGVSALSTATVSFNRDLQGMIMTAVCGNTDTNVGIITLRLYNNTAGAIDLASLNLSYSADKF